MQVNKGDTVQLIKGSPVMTVEVLPGGQIPGSNSNVSMHRCICIWKEPDGTVKRKTFKLSELKPVPREQGMLQTNNDYGID